MVKLLGLLLVLGVISVGGFTLLRNLTSTSDNQSVLDKLSVTDSLTKPTETTKPGSLSTGSAGLKLLTDDSSPDQKIKALETAIADLQSRIKQLESQTTKVITPPQSSTSTSKSPLYIPLGSGGSLSDQNWTSLAGYVVTLDPATYQGYISMNLEATMRLNQPGGSVKARLFNVTDNSAVGSSEVSISTTDFFLSSSTGFTIASGNKTYQMQVQSTSGTLFFIQSARVKVNF